MVPHHFAACDSIQSHGTIFVFGKLVMTFDRIWWIYSFFSETKLMEAGWDLTSVKKSDNDRSKHLWSELDQRGAPVEIHITGNNIETTLLMPDLYSIGEHIDLNSPEEYWQGNAYDQLMFRMKREDTPSYTGFH